MRNLSLISSTCLTLCLILECASASFKSQNVSHQCFRHEAVENGNVMKNRLEPNEIDKNAHRKPNRGKRTFFADDLWPNRIIPFKINYGTYINKNKINNVMAAAVNLFNRAGCVQWVPYTNQPNYVEIIGSRKLLCATRFGFRKTQVHELFLGEIGFTRVDGALHEMMHVAGAVHEQSRGSDRHKAITINWANIPRDKQHNFFGYVTSNAREYNIGSILHYEIGWRKEFTLNDPDLEYLLEGHTDLSFYDKAELNEFYKCADDCVNPPVCQNEGFVKQVRGVCSCECVDGLIGPNCRQVNTSVGCGGTIRLLSSESVLIDMLGYKTGLTCTWLIKGPAKTKIQVYINSVGLPTSIENNCYHYIEIRDYLPGAKGKLICGYSGGATFTKQNLGPTNIMIVRFDSDRYKTVSPGEGFTLTVTAAPSACSSSPCKYPAVCVDGTRKDKYTCSCTEGYSGTNCDTVAANATVTESFERDFSTLLTHGSSGVDFIWSTITYWTLKDVGITASDGYLMAVLAGGIANPPFPFGGVAKIQTSVFFKRANRCLRFNYGLAENIGGKHPTSLTVRISSDTGTSMIAFATNTGNKWKNAEIDLYAVNNMTIDFIGVYGNQGLVLDNIRITPLLCGAVNPCADAVCQNGGTCELVVNKSTLSAHSQCSCQVGFSGQYCEKYICTIKSCLNGVCFPLSSSTYTCDCDEGWSGSRCDTYACANVECNQGRCEPLSEIETRCICDNGWHGQFCDISTNPCEYMPCKHGVCEVMSLTEAQCVCNTIFWIGKYCDIWMFTPRL